MKEFTAQGHYIFQRNRVAHVGEFPSDLEASHAAACLNACHNIPEPEVTIPALVELLERIDPGWEISTDLSDGYAACEISVGDVRAIRSVLSKLNPSNT